VPEDYKIIGSFEIQVFVGPTIGNSYSENPVYGVLFGPNTLRRLCEYDNSGRVTYCKGVQLDVRSKEINFN
jgi:hypothetical protein